MADRVYCRPLIKDGRLVGFCFYVCNVPGPDQDVCYPQGCIWDLHLKILTEPCMFAGIISLPPNWDGVIGPPGPSPVFHAKTPPASPAGTALPANPIKPNECKRFCLRITPRCISPGECIIVRWVTTNANGGKRQVGRVQCCWPKAAAG
jgi:hypothetical protein